MKHADIDHTHNTCQTCKNRHTGNVCNKCGEKVFHQEQLSTKHFFTQVIDFFYHWENKVLRSLRLNFLKPGFITKENINGVRVPYAKPVQMYLVAAFVFYFVIKSLNVTDYIPAFGDHRYSQISSNYFFRWAKDIDVYVEKGIDDMWISNGFEIQKNIELQYADQFKDGTNFYISGRKTSNDTLVTDSSKISVIAFRTMTALRQKAYQDHVSLLGKSMIFILIPIMAFVIFVIFYKKIKFYGISLLLATHFMVYNLIVYTVFQVINRIPEKLGWIDHSWMFLPFEFIFYNEYTSFISRFIFGESFGFLHIILWAPWLFFAFKRLFNIHWVKNLLISIFLSRLFFYLIFGIYKKLLIAYAVYSLDV